MGYFLLAFIFWRCLWRGLVQMTRTTPARLTTLQFSQIRLTLVRTFMWSPASSPIVSRPPGHPVR